MIMGNCRLLFSVTICCCILVTAFKNVQAGKVLRLSSNNDMPVIGLGTHGLDGEVLEKVILSALDKGLRHIDTGFAYNNEETIGKILKKWFEKGGKREELFITSKLPFFGNRASTVNKFLKLSLERLGLEYIDMYLIHTPFGVLQKNDSYDIARTEDGTVIFDKETDPIAVWKEMEQQVKAGLAKSIGLSNFNESQISNILKIAEIKPSNLQVELHLYHQQKPMREFCQKHGIIITAYAPLGSSEARKELHPNQTEEEFPNLMRHPIVAEIAKEHGKSSPQVMLRHSLQQGMVVIPSSKNPNHFNSNLDIFDFELTNEEMARLDALDKGDRGMIFNYKFFKGIEKHPLYPFGNAAD